MEIIITQPILRGTGAIRPSLADPADDSGQYYEISVQQNPQPPFKILAYRDGYREFRETLRTGSDDGWDWFSLACWAQELSLAPTESKLLALEHLKDIWRRSEVLYYQHQLEAASRVINQLHGRAILADEVGLGKTVEAGLILKEYLLRKQVKKVLILTPASLCRQWQQELRDKFDLMAWIAKREWDWSINDLLISSLDFAKQPRNINVIRKQNYDLVIVDEAHKLKNEKTKNWQLVSALAAKYLLLLTATPVQNNLKELYNLITLLKPGQLGTYQEFKKRYMAGQRKPKNSESLRSLLSEVMIRNRRTDSGVNLPKRIIHTIEVNLSPEEDQLYQEVTSFLRRKAATYGLEVGLPLVTLQREVCSSPMAVAITLARMHQKAEETVKPEIYSLLEKAVAITNPSKAEVCLELIKQHQEKVIIFTEYRASLQYLLQYLTNAGFKVVGFDGSLSAGAKQWTAHIFRQRAQVMVATESGGEGLNFQFCNAMINYDLPWNPMRLEQRIGRIHRLGQERDVHVYNLSTLGTIEVHLLNLLVEKVKMFNMVVGQLEALFGNAGAFRSLESQIFKAVATSKDDSELANNFARLAKEIQEKQQNLEGDLWTQI